MAREILPDLLKLAHHIGRWDDLGIMEFIPSFARPVIQADLDLADRLRDEIANDPDLRQQLERALADTKTDERRRAATKLTDPGVLDG